MMHAMANNPLGDLVAGVVDQYGNPISNVDLQFKVVDIKNSDGTPLPSYDEELFRSLMFYHKTNCEDSAFPLFGECPPYYPLNKEGGTEQARVKSRFFGGMISAVAGNTVYTRYDVEVTTDDYKGVEPGQFTLFTLGSRNNDLSYLMPYLDMGRLEVYTYDRDIARAVKVGGRTPLVSRLTYYYSEPIIGPMQYDPERTPHTWWPVSSDGIVHTVPVVTGGGRCLGSEGSMFANVEVHYDVTEGDGIITNTVSRGNGIYEAEYRSVKKDDTTEPAAPAKNRIEAWAEIKHNCVPEVIARSSVLDPSVPESPVDMKTGQNIRFLFETDLDVQKICIESEAPLFTCTGEEGDRFHKEAYTVYSVDVKLDFDTPAVLDESGMTLSDAWYRYRILPDGLLEDGAPSPDPDAAYRAYDAYLNIYEDDSWVDYIVGEKTTGEGTGAIVSGSYFDINKKHTAQIVLNLGSDIEVRSERIEIPFANMYIEKIDPEYPDVKLRWNDYYPALGEKIVTVRSDSEALNGKAVTCRVDSPIQDANDPAITCSVHEETVLTGGKMRFRLYGKDIAPKINEEDTNGVDEIRLRFAVEENDENNQTTVLGEIFAVYNVKNNSNTDLAEVLKGEAVFTYDIGSGSAHTGVSDQNASSDNERKLDYVQELLNQVVPRKRSVFGYDLVEENGIYDETVEDAVSDFNAHFKMPNRNLETTNEIFGKLMKDYNRTTDEEKIAMLGRIVDKELLIGETQRIGLTNVSENDALINNVGGNTVNDTGLYELYKNVVVRFVKAMIEEGKEYVDDTTAFRDRDGTERQGVSYSFGRKQTLTDYQSKVEPVGSTCYAPASDDGKRRLYYKDHNGDVKSTKSIKLVNAAGVDSAYNGKKINGETCTVTTGRQYAGLTSSERESYMKGRQQSYTYGGNLIHTFYYFEDSLALTDQWPAHEQFKQNKWAGIDCAGFVQRMMMLGREQWAKDIGIQFVRTLPALQGSSDLLSGYTESGVDNGALGSMQFNCDGNSGRCSGTLESVPPIESGRVYKMDKDKAAYLRKGDLFFKSGGIGHVAMVYSDKPDSCSTGSNGDSKCKYTIIHASGVNYYDFNGNKIDDPEEFSRKVLINENKWLRNPSGFGRIKLWD